MRIDGLNLPDHIVARYMENELGQIVPVLSGEEIVCTEATAATLVTKAGVKIVIVTQYPKNAQATSVAGTSFNGSFLGTAEATEGYELQVATNTTFTALVSGYPSTLAAGTGTRTFAVTGLIANTNYYFRVKSLSTVNAESIWSSSIKVKTAAIRSVEFAATSPFFNWDLKETSGTIASDSTIHARNGAITGTVTYAKTAIDQSETANKSQGHTSTTHIILDFPVQAGATLGFGFSLDYKGAGITSGRSLCFHNTANGNTQLFVARSSSTIKARIKIQNAAGVSLLDTETNSDFFNNVRNNISVSVVGNAYIIMVNGVVDKSGTFASQATNAFDFNRVVLNGFGTTSSIGNHNSGDYGRVAVWFGGVPTQTQLATLYSIGLWA